jgi:hypothetical protein
MTNSGLERCQRPPAVPLAQSPPEPFQGLLVPHSALRVADNGVVASTAKLNDAGLLSAG